MKEGKNYYKNIKKFLQEDSWASFFVTLLLAFIIIKYIFFPTLTLLTGTSLPLVIVESCSMHHQEQGFNNVFLSPLYKEKGITKEETNNWIFPDGFNKGDVIFVTGANNIEIGDVIIFEAGSQHPLIHRVIEIKEDGTIGTKGDNYKTNSRQLAQEKSITKEQILGKAAFRIPIIGWAKLIFFEPGRNKEERGICS